MSVKGDNLNSLPNCSKSVEDSVFSPDAAPLRPGKDKLLFAPVLAIPFGLLAFVFNFHPAIGGIGWLGMMTAFVAPYLQWRHYERVGWYERREVVSPKLPYEMRSFGERIVFDTESMTHTLFPRPKRLISYAQIVEVRVDSRGEQLSGVTLNVKSNQTGRIISEFLCDTNNGERTRMILAILRAKASHATFNGPEWIEEGWVPRLGFSHPSSGGTGAAGP